MPSRSWSSSRVDRSCKVAPVFRVAQTITGGDWSKWTHFEHYRRLTTKQQPIRWFTSSSCFTILPQSEHWTGDKIEEAVFSYWSSSCCLVCCRNITRNSFALFSIHNIINDPLHGLLQSTFETTGGYVVKMEIDLNGLKGGDPEKGGERRFSSCPSTYRKLYPTSGVQKPDVAIAIIILL